MSNSFKYVSLKQHKSNPILFNPPNTIDRDTYDKNAFEDLSLPMIIAGDKLRSSNNSIEDCLPQSDLDQILSNFNDLDFLNKKFDELREKEIDGHITDVEKILLYEVLEKRILEFPNPHVPSDHEEAIKAFKGFQTLEKNFRKTHKNVGQKLSKFFSLFSWLD